HRPPRRGAPAPPPDRRRGGAGRPAAAPARALGRAGRARHPSPGAHPAGVPLREARRRRAPLRLHPHADAGRGLRERAPGAPPRPPCEDGAGAGSGVCRPPRRGGRPARLPLRAHGSCRQGGPLPHASRRQGRAQSRAHRGGEDPGGSAHPRRPPPDRRAGPPPDRAGPRPVILPEPGRPREGLEHGRQAVVLLTVAEERWWIGPAHWATGLNHALLGQFEPALEAERLAAASAEAVGDPQLESSAAWARGVVLTAMGEWDSGIRACEQAVACSPDPLNTALALGWLGLAHLETGDIDQAIPRLEQAIRLLGQFPFPQPQAWFMSFLAECHCIARRLETALDLASQALELARTATSSPGVGWAERALGRIAQARGALDDAADHFGEALRAYTAGGAEYDVARIHLDLAELAGTRGDREVAARYLGEALRRFGDLGLPHYVGRAETLAASLGVALPPLVVQ